MLVWWRKHQGWCWQALALILFTMTLLALANNTAHNIQKAGLASGFDFLHSTAGFDIGYHFLDYTESDTYGRAFIIGVSNTLMASAIGIVFATILGFFIGMCRTLNHWLLSHLAGLYVEIVRNIPLLLQLFFWYFAVLQNLPGPADSYSLDNSIFMNIRGLYLPRLLDLWHWSWEVPVLDGFDFTGGTHVVPELAALIIALSIYTAAFIAEVVRGGLNAVSAGQREASEALGLSQVQTLRYVVVPQAMRVIMPPLANQYMNLTKNSTLAAAIAFPDLIHIFAGTALLQTGQAVEIMALTMAFYLVVSVTIAIIMNIINRRFMRYGLIH